MTFDYKEYFRGIKPKTELAIYNRFLFAFLSVHTTWEANIRAYELMKGKRYTSYNEVKEDLMKARIGLYNNKSQYIFDFANSFWIYPKQYMKKADETWVAYRNRLVENIRGLGYAKASFAIEMIYPNAAWVTCIDTHIAQYFGIRQEELTVKKYHELEKQFCELAKKEKKLPTQFRWEYWDRKQQQENPRYWSYVLESETI